MIDITDNYLRTPFLGNLDADLREKYIKMMYSDFWMKKVVVSAAPYSLIKHDENIYKLPIINVCSENENLYRVSFYFGSVLHEQDNELIVYVNQNGNIVGTETYILE